VKLLQRWGGSFPVCFSCHNKISQTGWIKQQKFISHSSGGGEVQDQGASKVGEDTDLKDKPRVQDRVVKSRRNSGCVVLVQGS
ncbi:hypothetical protein H8958_009499, partial [Nasalis larvatus]